MKSRKFLIFQNRSKCENLDIWRSVLAKKSLFFLRNFNFFGWGVYWAGSQYWVKYLCIFSRGADTIGKKIEKIVKTRQFSIFHNRSKCENLDIWRSVLPKKSSFLQNFHLFFWAGAYTGRAPGTGENTYAFSAWYHKVVYICSLSNGSLRLA